jgi:hypothetical protein
MVAIPLTSNPTTQAWGREAAWWAQYFSAVTVRLLQVELQALIRALWLLLVVLEQVFVAMAVAAVRIPAEAWLGVGAFGSAAMYCAYEAITGYLADPRTLSEVGLTVLGGLLICLVVVALVGWVKSGGRRHAAHGHAHVHHFSGRDGGREALMRHEKAHQRVGARVGAGGSTVRIWQEEGGWSGVTHFHDQRKLAKLTPEKSIAISLAGILAAPNTTSPTDLPHAKATAATTPNPAKAMREGKKIARRKLW